MVRGFGIAVTAVALMYQCADTTRIARGRGTESPNARHALVYRLLCSAFIGFPWPMNAAGMVWGEVVMAPRISRTSERGRTVRRIVAGTLAPDAASGPTVVFMEISPSKDGTKNDGTKQDGWKVGALASATGLTVRALHHYD